MPHKIDIKNNTWQGSPKKLNAFVFGTLMQARNEFKWLIQSLSTDPMCWSETIKL